MKTEVKWLTLENETGEHSLRQHAFKPTESVRRYTNEAYTGNISLCGLVFADDGSGDGEVGDWDKLDSEITHAQCCKICKRKFDIEPKEDKI